MVGQKSADMHMARHCSTKFIVCFATLVLLNSNTTTKSPAGTFDSSSDRLEVVLVSQCKSGSRTA